MGFPFGLVLKITENRELVCCSLLLPIMNCTRFSHIYVESLTFVPQMEKLIRNTAAAYLLALMLVKLLAVPLIFLHYEFNKDFITANFCENKARPAMHCNGKCHLSKQLAKAAEKPATSEKNNIKLAPLDFTEQIEAIDLDDQQQFVRQFNHFRNLPYSASYYPSIFHPPAFTA